MISRSKWWQQILRQLRQHGHWCLLGACLLSGFVSLAQVDVLPPTSTDELTEILAELDRLGFRGQVALFIVFLPILLIAGASEAIGQSYVLFANRVRPFRFVLTLLINIAIFITAYLVTVLSVWITGRFIFGYEAVAQRGIIAVAASYLPLWLGFLAALPYLGSYIMYLLYFFVYLRLGQFLIEFGYTSVEAIVSVGLSLAIVYALRATVGKPLVWLVDRLRNAVAGTQLERSVEEALLKQDRVLLEREG